MSNRDDPTVSARVPRKPPSYPKLEAEGWDKEDPTIIMRNSLARVEGTTEGSRRALAEQVADARGSARRALRRCR